MNLKYLFLKKFILDLKNNDYIFIISFVLIFNFNELLT